MALRRARLRSLAAPMLSVGLLAAATVSAQAPGEIDWHGGGLEAARAEALETGKPLLAVFRCEP